MILWAVIIVIAILGLLCWMATEFPSDPEAGEDRHP